MKDKYVLPGIVLDKNYSIVKRFSNIKKAFEYISKHIDKDYSAITIGFD